MKDEKTPEERAEFWSKYPGDVETAMRKMAASFTPTRKDLDTMAKIKTRMFNDVLNAHNDWFVENMPKALISSEELDSLLEDTLDVVSTWMKGLHNGKIEPEHYFLMSKSLTYTREFLWGDTGLETMTRQYILDKGWLNTPMGTLAGIDLVLASEIMARTFHRMSFQLCNNRDTIAYEFHKAAGNFDQKTE